MEEFWYTKYQKEGPNHTRLSVIGNLINIQGGSTPQCLTQIHPNLS